MTPRTPSMADLLAYAMDSRLRDLHVALPGRVERYDATQCLADVKPLLRESHEDGDGNRVSASIPVVPNVPVVFPGGGGFRITFPIQSGDTVLLVFGERSLDAWLTGTGGEVDPGDVRMHHLSDAVAIPGLKPFGAPWQDAGQGVITLGSDGGPADFVALAGKVQAQLDALKDSLAGWAPVANDGGAALKTTLTNLFLTWPASVASGTVKIKG